jgi:hypothetical protein
MEGLFTFQRPFEEIKGPFERPVGLFEEYGSLARALSSMERSR